MASNIGCFAGCNNPVIGQCGGYNGNCGQFYCREHSKERLCTECSEKKLRYEIHQAAEAMMIEIRRDYTEAAKRVTRRAGIIPYIFMLLPLAGISLPVIFNKGHQDMMDGIHGFLGLVVIVTIPCIWYIWGQNRRAKRSLAEADKSRPNFRKYYENYLSQEAAAQAAWDREMLSGAFRDLASGLVVGAVKGADMAAKRMIRDVATPAESAEVLEIRALGEKLKQH